MLSFTEAARSGSPGVAEAIASKLLGGISTCNTFLLVQNDMVEGFNALSKYSGIAHFKSQKAVPTITHGEGEMAGFLRAWEAMTDLLATVSKASAHLSDVLNSKVCSPMTALIHKLQQIRTSLNLGANEPRSDSPALRDAERANERLKLADDELKAAIESRETLLNRFGNSIKPALRDRADERVQRARDLLLKAQKQHSDVSSQPSSPRTPPRSPTSDNFSPSDLAQVDSSELRRLLVVREGLRLTARSFFEFQRVMVHKIANIAVQIDSFDPVADTQMWLAMTLKRPLDENTRKSSSQLPVATVDELKQIGIGGLADVVIASNAANTAASGLEQRLKDREHQLEASNLEVGKLKTRLKEMQSKNLKLQSENDSLKVEVSHLREALNSRQVAKSNSIDAAKIDKASKKRKVEEERYESQSSSSIVVSPRTQQRGRDQGERQWEACEAEVVAVAAEELSRHPTVESMMEEYRKSPSVQEALRSDSRIQTFPRPLEEQPSPYKDDDELVGSSSGPRDIIDELARHVPNMHQVLNKPMSNTLTPKERLFQIEKRYEEFLLSLRNLDLSLIARQRTGWDNTNYFAGPAIEYGFHYYPFKVPGGLSYDTSTKTPPFALEWGAKRFDEFQWKCIAYETLLLCHEQMNKVASIHQLIELPLRDIRLVNPDEYRVFVHSMRSATRANRSRRKSSHTMKSKMAVTFAQDNLQLVRKLVSLSRVKLGIDGKQNRTILQLMLSGGASESSFGVWTGVHPLDVRYRVVRLLDSWEIADAPNEEGDPYVTDKGFREWILRQLHVVHCAICFRVCRLQKFLPTYSSNWMHDWTDRGPWYRPMTGRLTRFPPDVVSYTKGKANKIVTCAEEAFTIIAGLTRAVDQIRWGEELFKPEKDQSDAYRNKSGIVKLFQLMTCMDTLDRALQAQFQKETDIDRGYVQEEREGLRLAASKRRASKMPEGFNADNQILGMLASDESLVLSWPYETPFLQLVLNYIWRTCCDPNSNSKLNIDARPLAQGVLVAATQLQVPRDTTKHRSPRCVPFLSLQTHAMMFAHAVWAEASESPPKSLFDFSIEADEVMSSTDLSKKRNVTVISDEAIKTVNIILLEFDDWISGNINDLEDVADQSDSSAQYASSTVCAPPTDSFIIIRGERLRNSIPRDIKDCLALPYESNAPAMDPDAFDPMDFPQIGIEDFNVVDLSEVVTLPENDDIDYLDTNRPKTFSGAGALSKFTITSPSRTERGITELLYRRLLGSQFMTCVCGVLEDYRLRIEPTGLQQLINCWDTLRKLMLLDPPEVTPCPKMERDPDNELDPDVPLPILLKGPETHHDMYRRFIIRTCRNLYERVFEESIATLKSHSQEGNVVEVIKAFSDSLNEYIEELRCELEFYPSKWSFFLPDNQHAVIVMHAARHDLSESLGILLNCDYWPSDDVPPGGTVILAGIKAYEHLENAVREVVRYPVAIKPNLFELFAVSLTAALAKRFSTVEEILDRCLKTETWEALDPPASSHSLVVVDFFIFIGHIFDAISELCAPIEWILPTFLKFLGRMCQNYTTFMSNSTSDAPLNAIRERAETIFNNLHNPIARAGEIRFGLNDVKKEKTSKRVKGGILKGLGFGGSSKKKEEQKKKVAPSVAEVSQLTGAADEELSVSEEAKSTPSLPSIKKSKKSKKGKAKGEETLTSEQMEMASRIGIELTTMLRNVGMVFEGKPLTQWLVRMHNLKFFSEQLPKLGQRFIDLSSMVSQDTKDTRSEKIQQTLIEASGEKRSKRRSRKLQNPKLAKDEDSLNSIREVLEEVLSQCYSRVRECTVAICNSLCARLIYYELAPDIFEDLYSPQFGNNSLTIEDLANALRQTVGRFINECPYEFWGFLNGSLLQHLAKAWIMLVSELGYNGHVFNDSDLSVLDEDSEALKDYADANSLPSKLDITEDGQVKSVNLFEYINDFFVLIASKPHCLAAMGGKYNPAPGGAKSKGGTATDSQSPSKGGTTAQKPAIEDMFGGAPPSAASAQQLQSTVTSESAKGAGKKKRKGIGKFFKF